MTFTFFPDIRRRTDKVQFITNLPLFSIVLSLFSGALCFILPAKAAKNYTIAYESVLIAMVSLVLYYTLETKESFTYVMGEFPAPWGNEIRAGVLEATLALVFLIILLCSVIAGWRFLLQDLDESKLNLYFSLLNLLTAALMALLWTNDIFTGYVFLEILTLTSCGILIVREIGRTTLAAVRYMVLNLLGSGLFLLGVILLYDLTGHLLMVNMHLAVEELAADPANLRILSLSLGVTTIGLSIKSGLFPFHFWMPDTYGWATPTSASVLSSLVSKAYIFLLFKIYYRVFGPAVLHDLFLGNILLVLGMLGIIFGSVSALRANNINRMVAFSSAAQIGYIYMGLGLGTTAGFTAAIFHILAHALTKSLLFVTTPRLAEVSGESLLFRRLHGSAHRSPQAGFFFAVGAFSMIGIPFLAGFSSKLLFGMAAVSSGRRTVMILVMIVLAVSSLLNAMYFIRTLIRIYAAPEAPKPDEAPNSAGSAEYIVPALILTAGNLFLGLFSWVIVYLIHRGLGMFI